MWIWWDVSRRSAFCKIGFLELDTRPQRLARRHSRNGPCTHDFVVWSCVFVWWQTHWSNWWFCALSFATRSYFFSFILWLRRLDHSGWTNQVVLFFFCLFVGIKPENPYFASCPGLKVHSGSVALPVFLPNVHHRPEPLYVPSEVNTRQVDGLVRIPGPTQAPYRCILSNRIAFRDPPRLFPLCPVAPAVSCLEHKEVRVRVGRGQPMNDLVVWESGHPSTNKNWIKPNSFFLFLGFCRPNPITTVAMFFLLFIQFFDPILVFPPKSALMAPTRREVRDDRSFFLTFLGFDDPT